MFTQYQHQGLVTHCYPRGLGNYCGPVHNRRACSWSMERTADKSSTRTAGARAADPFVPPQLIFVETRGTQLLYQ